MKGLDYYELVAAQGVEIFKAQTFALDLGWNQHPYRKQHE